MPDNSPFAEHGSFRDLRDHLEVAPANRDLIWEHRLGQLVAELCPPGARGREGVSGLAAALGGGPVSKNRLWNARAAYAVFSVAELRSIQQTARAADFGFSHCHLTLAMSLPKRSRARILCRCINEKWTVVAMRREVRKLLGGKKRSGGGVPPLTPKSAEDALDDMIDRTITWLNRFDVAWFNGGDAVLGKPIGARTAQRLSGKLTEAGDVLSRIQRAAESGRRILQSQH